MDYFQYRGLTFKLKIAHAGPHSYRYDSQMAEIIDELENQRQTVGWILASDIAICSLALSALWTATRLTRPETTLIKP